MIVKRYSTEKEFWKDSEAYLLLIGILDWPQPKSVEVNFVGFDPATRCLLPATPHTIVLVAANGSVALPSA